jgi:hypothetical protein
VAVESSRFAYLISLDLLHIVGHLIVKKNTFYIADYLRFPGLNFGAIFSVTLTCFVRGTCRSTWKRHSARKAITLIVEVAYAGGAHMILVVLTVSFVPSGNV